LFEGVGVDMTSEELEISRSTPGARFDESAPSARSALDPSHPGPVVGPLV